MKLRLPEVPQTQDQELHTELLKVYAAIRAMHAHAISSGPMLYGTAGETIAVGDLVGVKPDGKYYKVFRVFRDFWCFFDDFLMIFLRFHFQ